MTVPVLAAPEEQLLIEQAQTRIDLAVHRLGQLRSDFLNQEKRLLEQLNEAEHERDLIIRSIGRRLKLDEAQHWAWDPNTKTFVIPG